MKRLIFLVFFLSTVLLSTNPSPAIAHGVHLDSEDEIHEAIQGYVTLVEKLREFSKKGTQEAIPDEAVIKLHYGNGEYFYYPQSVFSSAVYEVMSRYFENLEHTCGGCDVSHAKKEFKGKFQRFLHGTKEKAFDLSTGLWNIVKNPGKSLGRLSGYALENVVERGFIFLVIFIAFETVEHSLMTPVPLCAAFVGIYASTVGNVKQFCSVARQDPLKGHSFKEKFKKAGLTSLFDARFFFRLKKAFFFVQSKNGSGKNLLEVSKGDVEEWLGHEGAWVAMMAEHGFFGEVAQAHLEKEQGKRLQEPSYRDKPLVQYERNFYTDIDRILGLTPLLETSVFQGDEQPSLEEKKAYLVHQHLISFMSLKKVSGQLFSSAYQQDLITYGEFIQAKLVLGRLGKALTLYRHALLSFTVTKPGANVYQQREALFYFARNLSVTFDQISSALSQLEGGEKRVLENSSLKKEMVFAKERLKNLKKELKSFSKGEFTVSNSCEEFLKSN